MTGLEEPLGSRGYILFSFFLFAVFISSPILGQNAASECPDRLREMVHNTIDLVSRSRTENTDASRHTLIQFEKEIRQRVEKICADHATCNVDQLAETTLRVVHEVLDENPARVSRWRGRALFAGSLVSYLTANVWVAMNTNSVTAASVSAVLTVLGVMALTSSGASSVEPFFARLRRWSYSVDGSRQLLRGAEQTRQARIYRRTQEVLDETEEDGRNTDRHVTAQINTAELACAPHVGESVERFLERCAAVIGRTLSDLVPGYTELDFSEPQYSSWARVLFSRWYLNDGNREGFRNQVMAEISAEDEKAVPGTEHWEKYERVVRAWTSPPATLPQHNRR